MCLWSLVNIIGLFLSKVMIFNLSVNKTLWFLKVYLFFFLFVFLKQKFRVKRLLSQP
jgi:hypothetical protein